MLGLCPAFFAVTGLAGTGEVVVLANRNVPESVDLARHYMKARQIPADHLCELDLPTGEIISRDLYDSQLRDPLLQFLRDRKMIGQVQRDPKTVRRYETGWTTVSSSVKYVVSMYGVPVRIADTKPRLVLAVAMKMGSPHFKNAAAVDSELALLLSGPYEINGPRSNPLFNVWRYEDLGPDSKQFVIAARLDGPDAATVRRMIDDTLQAEWYGLQGRAYFDSQGLEGDAYSMGDRWIREAYERFLREGYECQLDSSPELFGVAYPMEDAAVYLGWYAENVVGPFTRPGFKFRPGAIAYHLHSGSASLLRTATQHWAGPLLAKGAAATMGAVSEPFLSLTPQLNIFADRLCDGFSFGEGAYMSLGVVSWEMTVVGDPLYRPFKYTLDQQIEHLEKDKRPEVEWAYVRKMNQMVREGRFNPMLEFCRKKIQQTDSLVLRERLGDLYARNDLFKEAGEQYSYVLDHAKTAETAVRVGARWMLILNLLGQKEKAQKVGADLRARWKDSPVLPWLETSNP